MMDKEELQAVAEAAAKNIKTEADTPGAESFLVQKLSLNGVFRSG